MIKLLTLTLTLAAFAVSSTFADCPNGGCKKGDKDKKKDGDKSSMTQVVNF